ncbi:PspC domain-containing protein [Kineococcus sp. TBRC 1896]|uniref:PspC domain-containing protein n=1 Tax=Kineococcus mangrovi TaxID=1660183 RepID=A0ABV4HWP6_9ACTN
MSTPVLSRPARGKLIAGVCAGLGRRFGVSANVVRLLFVLSCLLPGPQFIVYVVLWIVLPKDTGGSAGGYGR